MAKFQKTGLMEHTSKHAPHYGDDSGQDYQEAQFTIAKANSMYEELPSTIRNEFSGPAEFLDFVHDPKSEQKMREMGMIPKKPEEDDKQPPADKPPKDKLPDEKDANVQPEANKGDPDKKQTGVT